MEKESFTFFRSYYESFKNLPPETVGEVVLAMGSYIFDGEEAELEGIPKAIFELIRPVVERSMEISKERKRSVINRWSKEKNQASETNDIQTGYKTDTNDIQTGYKGHTDKEKEKDKDIFKTPQTPLGLFEDPELDSVFGEYLASRREQGASCDIPRIQRKLFDLAKGDKAKMILILEQSITQGWKGLFELKEEKTRAPTNKLKNHEERDYGDMSELEKEMVARSMKKGGQNE